LTRRRKGPQLSLPVQEIDYDTGRMTFSSPDGRLALDYEDGTLTITATAPPE
jgi:hypothetical protein